MSGTLTVTVSDHQRAELMKQFLNEPRANIYSTETWKVIKVLIKNKQNEPEAPPPVPPEDVKVAKPGATKAGLQAIIDSVPAKPVAPPGQNGHFKTGAYFRMRELFSNDITPTHTQDWVDDFPAKNVNQVMDNCIFECLDHPEVEVKNYKDFVKQHLKAE